MGCVEQGKVRIVHTLFSVLEQFYFWISCTAGLCHFLFFVFLVNSFTVLLKYHSCVNCFFLTTCNYIDQILLINPLQLYEHLSSELFELTFWEESRKQASYLDIQHFHNASIPLTFSSVGRAGIHSYSSCNSRKRERTRMQNGQWIR